MITIIILAGDFVKFGFTMASTTTILAWGYLSYKDAYEEVSKYSVFVRYLFYLIFVHKPYIIEDNFTDI